MRLPTDRLPHGWQVLATLLLVGSVFTAAWGLSRAGLLDVAATGLSFFAMTLARLLGPSLVGNSAPEFAGSAQLIAQLRADLTAWMASRRVLSLVLIALALTVVFLTLRAVTSVLLAAIASPWLALAVGLALAGAVASPVLIRGLLETLNVAGSRNIRTDDNREVTQ